MSEDQTPRLKLPVLQIGQSSREYTHNEALALLDIVVAGAVEDAGTNVPPRDPQLGQCWIVGPEPTEEWVGNARAIAGWTDGGWRFVAAPQGLSVWCVARQRPLTYRDGWEDGVIRATCVVVEGTPVIGARQPAIANPDGGATVDTQARAALGSILAAMRAHGLIG